VTSLLREFYAEGHEEQDEEEWKRLNRWWFGGGIFDDYKNGRPTPILGANRQDRGSL